MANYLFPIPSDSQVYLQAPQLTKPYRNFRFSYNFSAKPETGLKGLIEENSTDAALFSSFRCRDI
jgi:hypothetical protein